MDCGVYQIQVIGMMVMDGNFIRNCELKSVDC